MFSQKQIEVFQFPYEDQYDYLICDGAIRAGKTSSMIFSFILWSMATFNECNFIIAGKTISSIERNMIKPIQGIRYFQQQNFVITYYIGMHSMVIERGAKRNYYYCFGGVDESSYQSVQGLTAAGALVDEVALMPESFVNQVVARCSVRGSKTMFNCNPEEDTHWFNLKWIMQAKEKKAKHIHWLLEDNPTLSDEVIERYKRSYTGVFYKRYIEGIWCKAEGLIYKIFADNNEKYIIEEENPDNIWFLETGVDFGNNLSAHTFATIGFWHNFEGITILEENKETNSITPDILDETFNIYINRVFDKYQQAFIVNCDSAETTLINGLKVTAYNNNLPIEIQNARKKPIKDRIMLFCRLFAENRIRICRRCKNSISAFNNATWDAKKPDTRLDVVGAFNPVDMLDAIEYSVEKHSNELMKLY